MARPTKYNLFETEMANRIQNRIYPPGHALPSEQNLCQEFNLSRSTVRKALIKLKDRGMVSSVGGKGYFVRGREIRESRYDTSQIGLIMGINYQNWSLTHFPCMLFTLLEEKLASRNQKLVHVQPDKFKTIQELIVFLENFPGDVVLINRQTLVELNGDYFFNKFLPRFDKRIVVFTFETPVEFIATDLVFADWTTALGDAVSMLADQGYRKIVYAGYDQLYWSQYRKCAFLLAMREAGLWDFGQEDPYLSYSGKIEYSGNNRPSTRNAVLAAESIVKQIKAAKDIEAVIFAHDILIKEASAIFDIGSIRKIIGFDNDFWTRDAGISSISINLGAMCEEIFKLIDNNSDIPRQIAVPSVLMQR